MMNDQPASEDFSHGVCRACEGTGYRDKGRPRLTLDRQPCPICSVPDSFGRIRTDLADGAVMENGMKNQTTSAHRAWGKSTIYGKDGEHRTPYMTRWWIGRLRFHVFLRGDADPDPHDHPWGFWTFPLTSYVEEVAEPDGFSSFWKMTRQVVPAFRFSYRPATHTHRVLGRYYGPGMTPDYPQWGPGKIVTIVWRGKDERKWGFLKNRDGRWCWVHWKEYVFGEGKSAPCE